MTPLMDSWRSKWNKSRDFVVDTCVNGLLSIVYNSCPDEDLFDKELGRNF